MQTPPPLLQGLIELNGKDLADIQPKLTKFIKNLSIQYNCPFISKNTGYRQCTQLYSCSMASEGCQAYIEFKIVNSKVYYLGGFHTHNHEVSNFMTQAVQSYLSADIIEKIRTATRYGADASTIRRKFNLRCSPDVLYYYRRDLLHDGECCEVDEMLQEIGNWEDWKILFISEDGTIAESNHFYCAVFINLRVARMEYAHDIIITDDTMCATHFSLPVSILLTVDPHDNTQVTGFGFLPGKCTTDFEFFFSKYKDAIENTVRLFILDRSQAQICGISTVYPDTDYIFCRKHISRNLEDNFGAGSDVVLKYYQFMNEKITEELFVQYIELKIDELKENGSLGAKALCILLDSQDHWFPRCINKKIHRNNLTTNRAEGFFGTFKRLIGNKPQTLAIVVRCLRILSERLMAISFLETYPHLGLPIILPNDATLIGKFASDVITNEYEKYKNNLQSSSYCGYCCYISCVYGLPCRHFIAEKAQNSFDSVLLQITDINPIYYWRSHAILQNTAAEIITSEIEKQEPVWNRTNIIATFMSLTDNIIRCPEVKEKILEFFRYCDSLKLSTTRDPPVQKTSGRPLQNAAQFVSTAKSPLYKKNKKNANKTRLQLTAHKERGQKSLYSYF